MAPGYEWVFLICYATMAFGGVLLVREAYVMILEYRERRVDRQDRRQRPGPPRRV
jgi:4-hydroxybenzoate polyprenyltransferase